MPDIKTTLNSKEITYTSFPDLNDNIETINKFYGFNKFIVVERKVYTTKFLFLKIPSLVFDVYIRNKQDDSNVIDVHLHDDSLKGVMNYIEGLLTAYEI